jgi:16S rRNA (cytidine1402-2'-O)-methyltransferase
MALAPGLYIVATPIGAADDLTLRAIEVLRTASVIAAEDTRRIRKLMDIHGIRLNGRPLMPYHDHNGPAQRPRLMALLASGNSVAYASDAGTPLIADPGYRLVTEAIASGHAVLSLPGPSAVLAALTVSGLPTDRFMFAGFPPPKAAARDSVLADLASVPSTLVFFESGRRLAGSLRAMARALGGDRPAAVCRELTKLHEEVRRGTLDMLAADCDGQPDPKGEIVVVVGPPPARDVAATDIDTALVAALALLSLKEAAAKVAQDLGISRKDAYQRALALRRQQHDADGPPQEG